MPETPFDTFFPNAAIYDEDELAFTAGDIGLAPGALPMLSPYNGFVGLDQRSDEDAYMACTIVARLNQTARLWGKSPTQQEMLDYIDYATKVPKPSYVIGEGRHTRYGANAVRNKRNANNPKQKVIVITGTIGDEIFREAYNKNHMIGLTYKGNSTYNRDFSKEGILDGKDYKPTTYGHTPNALSVWAMKDMVGIFDNYDKRLTYNRYSIKYMSDLVKNGVFYPAYYLIIPANIVTETPEQIVKKKMNDKAVKHALYSLSCSYDSCTDPAIQKILADAANSIREKAGIIKDPGDQAVKARKSASYALSFTWNFIDDPAIQKMMADAAAALRKKYSIE